MKPEKNREKVENTTNDLPVGEQEQEEENQKEKKTQNSSDIVKKNDDNLLDKQKVIMEIQNIVNYIDEKNSKIAALLSDIEITNVTKEDIYLKVNSISDFIYDSLINDIDTIKGAFNLILKTNHNIVIDRGSAMKKENLNNKNKTKDEEHPLFMDFLEKFDGEILR